MCNIRAKHVKTGYREISRVFKMLFLVDILPLSHEHYQNITAKIKGYVVTMINLIDKNVVANLKKELTVNKI